MTAGIGAIGAILLSSGVISAEEEEFDVENMTNEELSKLLTEIIIPATNQLVIRTDWLKANVDELQETQARLVAQANTNAAIFRKRVSDLEVEVFGEVQEDVSAEDNGTEGLPA